MGGFSLLHPPDANFEDEKIVIHYFFNYPYEERNHNLMTSCWLVRSMHAKKKFNFLKGSLCTLSN